MLTTIISHFSIPGSFIRAERFGSGLINDTYVCEFSESGTLRKYILQRINPSVFKDPGQVMQNVEVVTTHIAKRLRAEGIADPSTVTPTLISTRSGQSFLRDDEDAYWRMFPFIESGKVYDIVMDGKHAYEVGRGLGRFQSLVSDLPPDLLHDTIPGFHHTPIYLQEFYSAVAADDMGRVSEVGTDIEFANRRSELASVLTDLMDAGDLPIRVVHNDPKVNNVLIHSVTREAICMLDLDTVKPGIVHFDFGDCVRSAANPAGEDAKDLESVSIDLALFEAVAGGYLREAGGFLTRKELELLPLSVKVITFELGIRFLADYLRGDTYFKIRYPTHNLHRARVQFRLLAGVESAEGKMVSCIARLSTSG